jgi:fatty acid desaturase
MMMGNWAQHSFIRADAPDDPYGASITCINTRYNRRCFNDGYHVLHHVKPACHWTEHPVEFERALAEYGRQDSIVFDGIDFFGVWLCLMTRRWSRLAEHFVVLEGAPSRTREQVVAFLKERVLPVGQPLELPAAVAAE